jgi:hypothetical protein
MDEIVQAGKFLKEQLRQVEPELIKTVYPEMWGFEGKFHPVKSGLSFGVSEIKTGRIDYTGVAVNYGGKATDIPLANYGIDSDGYKTLMGVLGVEWGWTELQQQEAAQTAGSLGAVNVVQEYSNALEKGLREWVHIRTLFGDSTSGFRGLFNHTDVETVVLTDDIYAMSPRDKHLYIKQLLTQFKKTSKLTATPVDMLCNSDLYDDLTDPISTSAGGGSEATPYEYLTDPKKGSNLRTIQEVNELSYDYLVQYGRILAAANQDMFVIYENSSDTLYKRFSGIKKTPVGLKDDMMTYRQTGMVKISEFIIPQPFRVRYYLYPKKA